MRPPFPTSSSPAGRGPRRGGWLVGLAAGAALRGRIGAPDRRPGAQRYSATGPLSLSITRRRTRTVFGQFEELRRALGDLKIQVGSDTTALNQDTSQLLGAETSLSAAQRHVTQQASLITSLQTCLIGVEQALNELAVEIQPPSRR